MERVDSSITGFAFPQEKQIDWNKEYHRKLTECAHLENDKKTLEKENTRLSLLVDILLEKLGEKK